MMRKYLFVVAHPDDEVFGGGATIKKLAQLGHEVYVCVLNNKSDIRCCDDEKTIQEMRETHRMLGVQNSIVGDFPTLQFNTIPHIELVKFIENVIVKFQPNIIITHHPIDLHNDHQVVSAACAVAARLPQRQLNPNLSTVDALYYMEVPASTDWGSAGRQDGFCPNTYSSIEQSHLTSKIRALQKYSEGGVLRATPHPRSEEVIKALAAKRGAEIGSEFAESFQVIFQKTM